MSRRLHGHIGGNPLSLVRFNDDRVCVLLGYQKQPCGLRTRITADENHAWGLEITVQDDGLTGDLCFSRGILPPNGKLLTINYFIGLRDVDRTVHATVWPPAR